MDPVSTSTDDHEYPRPTIDVDLVRRLVDSQFPQWSELPVTAVLPGGWDNRTFRLGAEFSVRLPSAQGYRLQVAKEHRWLPILAPRLPQPIPIPVGLGEPGHGYPFTWSVNRWLAGTPADAGDITDLDAFAEDLAAFLLALGEVDPSDGPPAGQHSAFRGCALTTYDEETRRTLDILGDRVPGRAARDCWDAALDAGSTTPPTWFHGDVAVGNLLVTDGRLSGVIDFGCSGVGDPACDLVIAWTLLTGSSRAAFRAAMGVDDATWQRGRGWALWKALITIDAPNSNDPHAVTNAHRVLAELLRDR